LQQVPNFKNKANVGLGENVVQLIKAHSFCTLLAVFEKNRIVQ
jgi:hypothetical protein